MLGALHSQHANLRRASLLANLRRASIYVLKSWIGSSVTRTTGVCTFFFPLWTLPGCEPVCHGVEGNLETHDRTQIISNAFNEVRELLSFSSDPIAIKSQLRQRWVLRQHSCKHSLLRQVIRLRPRCSRDTTPHCVSTPSNLALHPASWQLIPQSKAREIEIETCDAYREVIFT